MITEKEIKLEARLAAIELILARVMAIQLMNMPDEGFEEILQSWSESADGMTFPGAPPAVGDLWSQEVADSLRSLLAIARSTRALKHR